MMTPKFTDVVEYVRTGEDDSEMRTLLEQHPDGAELLKQARFIARMLKRSAEKSDDPGIAAKIGRVVARFESPAPIHAMRALEASSDEISSELWGSQDSIIGDGRGRDEDLGTLEISIEGDGVSLSYEPSEVAKSYSGKPMPEFAMPQPEIEGIEIRGAAIRIFLPDNVPAGEALPLRLAHGARQMPAVGRAIIFMPESGPFVRFKADEEGKVQLPVPEESGTLRIDAGVTQVVRLKRKK